MDIPYNPILNLFFLVRFRDRVRVRFALYKIGHGLGHENILDVYSTDAEGPVGR
jgi:hypothetical protein